LDATLASHLRNGPERDEVFSGDYLDCETATANFSPKSAYGHAPNRESHLDGLRKPQGRVWTDF
jgi:hypothetical protein